MNVLIVYAHPEPASFNGALKDLAVETLTAAGHQVQVSDLYAMNFKAVADRGDFLSIGNPDYFNYQGEQMHAATQSGYAPDIQAEHAKLVWADLVIFQFPLWWFGLPAILKGWVDRVMAFGVAYPGTYHQGKLNGKKAMLSLTTGGSEQVYQPGVRNGEIDMLLFPIQHGVLFFTGMEVLPPFVAYGVARVEPAAREQYLQAYRERLLTLESTAPLVFDYPKA